MSLHGGDIYKIYRETGKKVIDYSANINALGLPENLKKHIIKNIDNLVHYPDPNYLELKKAISNSISVPTENIITGNGATELIFLFIRALNPEKVLVISPTFAEYERALKEVHSEIHHFQLTEGSDGFFLNIENLKKELSKNYDLLILCNPNNPTGSFVKRKDFLEILGYSKNFNTKFLVDEAFIDFMWEGEELSFKHLKSEKVVIIRAFTKFFAIPGLRLGYAICFNEALMALAYKLKEPWTINTFAASCGKILLGNRKYIDKTHEVLKKERNRMLGKLNEIKEIKVFETNSNFILIRLMNMKGIDLYDLLLENGFLIRRCENFNFLDDSYIRLAIKDKKSNKKLLRALKNIMKNRKS